MGAEAVSVRPTVVRTMDETTGDWKRVTTSPQEYPMASRMSVRIRRFMMPASFALALSACGVSVDLPHLNGDGTGNQRDDVASENVLVAFVNLTTVDVDTEFYATNEPLDDKQTDLFVPGNRIQVGIGVAGTGILLSGTEDAIEFPCTPDLVLGTTGGTFKDPDLGTALGMGDARILSVGLIFDCGDAMTFTYGQEDGEFTVDVL